ALNSADRAAVAWVEQTARDVVDLPGTDPGTDAAPIPSYAADTVADGPKRRLAEPWPAAGVPTSPTPWHRQTTAAVPLPRLALGFEPVELDGRSRLNSPAGSLQLENRPNT